MLRRYPGVFGEEHTLPDILGNKSAKTQNKNLLTFTLLVDNSSDSPIGKTSYLSHKILWQLPKVPRTYFSRIMVRPRGDMMYLA